MWTYIIISKQGLSTTLAAELSDLYLNISIFKVYIANIDVYIFSTIEEYAGVLISEHYWKAAGPNPRFWPLKDLLYT